MALGLPETGLAIIPGAGGTQRLPRAVGISQAKRLIFTGERLGPAEAEAIGLVDEVVAGELPSDAAADTPAFEAALALGETIGPPPF